jgi:hypothetical protein
LAFFESGSPQQHRCDIIDIRRALRDRVALKRT